MTETRYSQYIEDYRTNYCEDTTIDFLNHLLIVPVRTQEDVKDQNYELSSLGILLVLATISLTRRGEHNTYFNYYDTIARNYQEKLPLIFGKWRLLKETLDFNRCSSLFDYLLGDYKSEILSLSVSLGGNKEIYDNVRSASLRTIIKFSTVYEDGNRALQSVDPEIRNTAYCLFIKEKINEIEISLTYTDLLSFGKYMMSKKRLKSNLAQLWLTFEDDLYFIEKSLADEFSFLFCIGLMRENDHKASDYPLTIASLQPYIGYAYPKHFLNHIAEVDDQIRNKLKEWIKESKSYQKIALEKMDDIYSKLELIK